MTTTVTVETHNWPVMVTAENDYSHSSPTQASHGNVVTHTFVPKGSKMQFYVTQNQTLEFVELPEDATGLPGCDEIDPAPTES